MQNHCVKKQTICIDFLYHFLYNFLYGLYD